MNRPPWPAYFMDLARVASTRSTCDRKHVGAVLVIDHRVIATGYNGSAPGAPHCDDVGHDMHGQHCSGCGVLRGRETGVMCLGPEAVNDLHQWTGGNCIRTIHAEENAILQAARHGVRVAGAHAYVNTFPCWRCFQALAGAGVTAVFYDDEYRNDARVLEYAKLSGMTVERLAVGYIRNLGG